MGAVEGFHRLAAGWWAEISESTGDEGALMAMALLS